MTTIGNNTWISWLLMTSGVIISSVEEPFVMIENILVEVVPYIDLLSLRPKTVYGFHIHTTRLFYNLRQSYM